MKWNSQYLNNIHSIQLCEFRIPKSTFSSSNVGVLFPSSITESELEVLVEAWLSDLLDSSVASSASLSAGSSGTFGGRFCRGRGTGTTMTDSGSSSVPVSGPAPFRGKGIGVVGDGVVGLGMSTECSSSKLVWLVWHGSFTGDWGDKGGDKSCNDMREQMIYGFYTTGSPTKSKCSHPSCNENVFYEFLVVLVGFKSRQYIVRLRTPSVPCWTKVQIH